MKENHRQAYDSFGFSEGKVKENNVISFLDKHAELFPGKIALKWAVKDAYRAWDGKSPLPHESITYNDFIEKISAVAGGLKKIGIGSGDRVVIFLPLSPELYLSIFAVQRIGAMAVFLDSWARRDQLGLCAQVVRPKGMISFEKAFELCSSVPELSGIQLKIVAGPHAGKYSGELESLLKYPGKADIEPVRQNDTALVTFTTGSSGAPKGADRTHHFLAAQHRALDAEIPYVENDKDLPVFPIFSLNNLAGGVTTVLPALDLAEPSDKDAATVISQILSEDVTCCTVSPSVFNDIAGYCHQNKVILSKLRRVVTGGAPVSKDNVEGFKAIAPSAEIIVLYGSTEVEPIAHIEAKEMLKEESEEKGVNVGSISEALSYKFIKIWRKSITLGINGWKEWEVASGKPGELIVSGAHVCEGYYNNQEAFNATKIRDGDGKIWHRTGDVGMLDGRGNLWLLGRVHNTIVRGGEYLFPVHAEMLLKKLEFVKQAAYLGMEDAFLGEKVCAVFSLKQGADPADVSGYANSIRDLLKESGIPLDQVRMVKEIPMDPRHHSKVEYSKLREALAENV